MNGNDTTEVMFEYTGKTSIPENVTHIRFHSSVVEVGNNIIFPIAECTQLKEVVLNEGLETIGSNAFEGLSVLESITLPSTLTEIDIYAFKGCCSLKEVVFNEGLKKIARAAFIQCTALQSIALPSTLTEIARSTFYGCRKLEEVVLNEGIKSIGIYAFRGCSSLRSITLPSTLIEIDQYAFCECTRLREVEFPEGIQKISEDAFNHCLALERLSFPSVSLRLQAIIEAGHTGIRRKLSFVGTDDIFIPRSYLRGWKMYRQSLDRIIEVITYYEMRDATTSFELALWKAKLDQAEEATDINREAYRIEVPGPVKDTILQYLR